MPCLTPITLKREVYKDINGSITNVVPCGKCPECLKKRRSDWLFRLVEEQKVSCSSIFLTLTYNDEHLPFSENGYPTLDKKAFPNFMKRLRKSFKSNYKIKYYAVGEYGTKSYRPHYHAIIFGLPRHLIKRYDTIQNAWSLQSSEIGNIRIDECNPATISYVLKYMSKHLFDTFDNDDRCTPFSLSSKGMGLSYLTPARVKYFKNRLTPITKLENGQIKLLPRYFKEKIFNKDELRLIALDTVEYVMGLEDKFENSKHEVDFKKQKFKQFEKQLVIQRQKL